MLISWRSSNAVACYHAADQVRQGRRLREDSLHSALIGPVEHLQRGLAEERLSVEGFWRLVVPLAGEFSAPRRLAEVVLTRLVGSVEAQPRIGRFERALAAVRSAFQQNYKPPADAPLVSRPLPQAWVLHAAGLLGEIGRLTEPGLLVESAVVYLLPDISGGAGEAHAVFNSARIEEVTDSADRPPEVLRLAWLLSQLNLDLPRFVEAVPGERRHLAAALSMIPVTLTAAEPARLATSNPEAIQRAVAGWLGPDERVPHWQQAIVDWWQVYQLQRPPWPAAMQALDALL